MKSIKKHKNKIFVTMVIFLALFVCYLIGQKVVLPSRMLKEGFTDADGKVVEYSILEHYNQFSFAGVGPMADVPGSQSMSVVTLDENSNVTQDWYGKYIFMTPNVSMATRMKIKRDYDSLSFWYGMHPWIKEGASDGAQIVVEILVNEEEEPVVRKVFQTDPSKDMTQAEIDLSSLKGKEVTIGISCTGGDNNNEDGDWVLLQYPVID